MGIEKVNLKTIYSVSGQLRELTSNQSIDVDIEVDALSKGRVASVLKEHEPRRENQDVRFEEIRIKKSDLDLLLKGQSGLIKQGNRYIMTAEPPRPAHFSAELTALAHGAANPNVVYAVQIQLGNIVFDLENKRYTQEGDDVVFSNVSATLFPGRYSVTLKE